MNKKTVVDKSYSYGLLGKLEQFSTAAVRQDARLPLKGGWANQLTGLGVDGKDKRLGMEVNWTQLLENEVEELFAMDDVAGRVISVVPEMGTRNWIDITVGEEDGGTDMKDKLDDEIKRLDYKDKCRHAWEWARLYGGAAIFWAVDDGQDLSQPLNLNNLKRVRNLTVLHRYELHPHSIDWDLESPNFGLPEWYYINPRSGALSPQQSKLIHWTRFTRFDGVVLPRQLHIRNNYWGDSVLTRLYNVLRNFNMSHDSMAAVTQDFRVGVLKIKNLADVVASGDETLLKTRIEIMNICKSVLGTMLLDAEDESYENMATTLNGIDNLLDKINSRLVIATGLPHTIVLGEGAAGTLGGGGDSETRNLNEFVSAHQEKVLTKPIDKDLEIMQSQLKGPTNGNVLESLSWEFSELRELTEVEKQTIKTGQSATDKNYWEIGSLSAEEIRESRFGGREFSTETIIQEDDNRNDAVEDHGHMEFAVNCSYTSGAILGDGSSAVGDPNHMHEMENGQFTGPAIEMPGGGHFHRVGNETTTPGVSMKQIEEFREMEKEFSGES